MRRWFLARFYRLGLGGWFGPPTRYVDKAPTETLVLGDEELVEILDGDALSPSAALADDLLVVAAAGDDVASSTPVGTPTLQNEVDP